MPEGESARSILFMPFSAEESGLNGAQHYTRNPTVPLDKIALMINFDMIGRLEKHRLNISGLGSGLGMAELIEPLKANNPLELVLEENTQAASDHWAFVQARVPAAFVSMDGIHDDYHTPRDTADLIRPVDAVHATHFVHDLAFAAARVEAPLAFQEPKPRTRQARNRVRFGVQMGEAPEGQQGVTITEVVEDGTAATAGVLAGDLLVKWDGKEVTSRMEWVTLLSGAKPGDEVSFVVMRGGKPVELKATLEGR
ncbi:MAG: M28 family peptidase [Planctomycetota bacterium]